MGVRVPPLGQRMKEMSFLVYYHTYIHGVGSSCHGDLYHHKVVHLSEYNITTLCGVEISGQNWWKDSSFRAFQFTDMIDEYTQPVSPGDIVFCKRCGRIYTKRNTWQSRNNFGISKPQAQNSNRIQIETGICKKVPCKKSPTIVGLFGQSPAHPDCSRLHPQNGQNFRTTFLYSFSLWAPLDFLLVNKILQCPSSHEKGCL